MQTQTQDFKSFGLPEPLVQTLDSIGFKVPTAIQAAGIPEALKGKDILAIAPTGTGKTGAFGIPAIASISTQTEKQVLILAPTRELAAQIFQFFESANPGKKLKGALLVGGESFRRQFFDWKDGVDYMVATPGRLMDHIEQGLDLKHIGILVLDEVDRMLDMGFSRQIEQIAKSVPKERQTLLFSATLPPDIQKIAQKYLKDPVRINANRDPKDVKPIREERIQVPRAEKPDMLLAQVRLREGKILIFTRTQHGTEDVADLLEKEGVPVARLHGGRTQSERKRSFEAYRKGLVRILVATDIAARGLDVPDIEVVINYDRAATQEDHLHRIGRTGRCGKKGVALTFVDGPQRGGYRSSGGRPPGGRPQGRRFDRFDRREQNFSRPGSEMTSPFPDKKRKVKKVVAGFIRKKKGPTKPTPWAGA